MVKRVIKNVQVRSVLSGVLYAPDYDEDGERVFRDKTGKRYPLSAQSDLPEDVRSSGINWCTHIAQVRDVLRRVIYEIPKNSQKPNDPNYILAIWRQVELSQSDALKLSPKIYKWLWKLLERPVTVKVENEEKPITLPYIQHLFGLDAAAIGITMVAEGDAGRLAKLTNLFDEDDEEDEDDMSQDSEDDDEDLE